MNATSPHFLCPVFPDSCQPVKDAAPSAPVPCPGSCQSGGAFTFASHEMSYVSTYIALLTKEDVSQHFCGKSDGFASAGKLTRWCSLNLYSLWYNVPQFLKEVSARWLLRYTIMTWRDTLPHAAGVLAYMFLTSICLLFQQQSPGRLMTFWMRTVNRTMFLCRNFSS